ncbi:MAG: threonine synthase [Ignavibacteriaceae bacterium]
MKFYSTNKRSKPVSFKEALLKGIADDDGLFMPEFIPQVPKTFLEKINNYTFNELSFFISKEFLKDDINDEDLKQIINEAFNFDAPLIQLDQNINILELFHGPTLAFKDFGARFMANLIKYFWQKRDKDLTILAATSGDTGSAVANAFFNIDDIKVILLYPSKKVSKIQEQQLTTLGGNVTALEVDGNFDDCQRLVKSAFADKEIKNEILLSSANSINISRLIPQSFYYFYAFAQLKNKSKQIIISVPSGNFGNLTGGLIAKKMGLPVSKFIAAVNANDVFTKYIKEGIFEPKPTVKTISNAMDVGNPSNFARITDLFNNNILQIKDIIFSESFSDSKTKKEMEKIFNKYNYIIDPHGTVGFLALQSFIAQNKIKEYNGIILETAHPAKFINTVEDAIKNKIEIPERLKSCLDKKKKSILISNKFEDLKNFLLQ